MVASVGETKAFADIKIIDDETASKKLTLSAEPDSAIVDAGETAIRITGTLDSGAAPEDLAFVLTLAPAGTEEDAAYKAVRDVDFSAVLKSSTPLTIAKDDLTGSTMVYISALKAGTSLSVMSADEPSAIDASAGIGIRLVAAPETEDGEADPGAFAFDIGEADPFSLTYDPPAGKEFELQLPGR